VAGALTTLGELLTRMGKHEEARRAAERALSLRQKVLGPEHSLVADTLTVLGIALTHLQRHDEARERLERALAIQEKRLGRQHPEVAYPLLALGQLLLAQGRPAEALKPLERALAQAPKSARAEAQFTLAQALWAARRTEHPRAVGLVREAREHWKRLGNPVRLEETSRWLSVHAGP
jgi:serine/threonine-protein kinase